MSAIEFRSVAKTYRSGRGVDALSFTIESGERIVLFGPSGCGKSTTLLLIAGLATPDSGDIAIDESFRRREEFSFRRSRAVLGWCFKTSRSGPT